MSTTSSSRTKTSRRQACNINDRRYRRSETRIRRVLLHALTKRRLSLHIQELCNHAKISTPTFYLHSANAESALHTYENELVQAFTALLPKVRVSREVIFLILLNFINRHRTYFHATIVQHNTWLLAKLFLELRPFLTHGSFVSDKCYDVYAGNLATIIYCWGKHEKFANAKIPLYAKKLIQVRIMDLGI